MILGALAASVFSFWTVNQYHKKANTANVLAMDIHVYRLLENVVEITPCDRALVLVLHNGGGKILAGSPKYSSALYESCSTNIAPIIKDFQAFEIDIDYTILIEQVKSRKMVLLMTSDMKEGMLKRRYETDGITAAIVVSLEETPNRYYYASFSTVGDPNVFMASANFARIETAVNQLRRRFEGAKRGGYLA